MEFKRELVLKRKRATENWSDRDIQKELNSEKKRKSWQKSSEE